MPSPQHVTNHKLVAIFKPTETSSSGELVQKKSPIGASFVTKEELATIAVPITASVATTSSGVVSNCGDNSYANFIYMHESGCSTTIKNSNGCYGLGQDCNSIVENLCGADYTCENNYFNNYANKYGGWAGSYAFWIAHSWW